MIARLWFRKKKEIMRDIDTDLHMRIASFCIRPITVTVHVLLFVAVCCCTDAKVVCTNYCSTTHDLWQKGTEKIP